MAAGMSHADRALAEGFGVSASAYDRHRPLYPVELFDELVALCPERVLDVGCGTGRVAAPLLQRGLDVLGVEPDVQMASVARARGVEVEIGTFEQWDDAGRRFDLVTCGAAWHWIDPHRGARKAATVLAPGGTLARFLTHRILDDEPLAALDAVYRAHAPETCSDGRPPSWLHDDDAVVADPAFARVRSHTLNGAWIYSADEWLGLVTTLSDHIALGPRRLNRLVDALRGVIDDDLGGSLHVTSRTHVVLATRL
ncbi:class I SAM-dependent methyltransferase [Pseudonocardia sp. RS010]|uniref:class I SAM-dependent methyltransferase n=1 Tax=Pseudonocardia sp. RS010 TaxID=3385979 RepID=UPI0039A1F2B4